MIGETLSDVRASVDDGAQCIWLIQLGSYWLLDSNDQDLETQESSEEWQRERDEIDRILLQALMTGQVQYVRRAVLYDVISDAGDRMSRNGVDPVSAHRRVTGRLADWKRELSRYVALFDDGTANYSIVASTARLSVQEVILGRVTASGSEDDRLWDGAEDGCIATEDTDFPAPWGKIGRMISLHGNLSSPLVDSNPLSAIPTLDLIEYRRR